MLWADVLRRVAWLLIFEAASAVPTFELDITWHIRICPGFLMVANAILGTSEAILSEIACILVLYFETWELLGYFLVLLHCFQIN